MDFHQLSGVELQQARYIWSQAFEHGSRAMKEWDAWDAHTPDGKTTYGISTEAGLQAAFLLVDEEIHIGAGALLPISAVCGVAVLPASRGRGFANSGMRACLDRMRESGAMISYLEPFSWEFYERLGYAWTAPTRQYVTPARILRTSQETERVRLATDADHAAVIGCYTAFAARYRGMLRRKPPLWAWYFDASPTESTYTYVYEHGGAVEGYLQYHGGTNELTSLDAFVVLTRRAQSGLLGLLRRHEMQTEKFRWRAPANDGLWLSIAHADLETRLRSRHMARIVDAARALGTLSPPKELATSIALRIADDSAPWNDGVWRLSVEGGELAVSAAREEPHVALDIQSLAQAYLGSPSLAELREAGQVSVHHEAAFAALAAILAGPPAWCDDGF